MMADKSTWLKTLRSVTLSENKLNRHFGKELGCGAYGKVYTVKYCGQLFAAKEIHPALLNIVCEKQKDIAVTSFLQECYHCANLRHPNIVQFIGVYWPDKQSVDLPVMVMEMMDCSLTKFITKPEPGIKLADKYSILHDVTLGLNYLHSHDPPIVHRDLSPNNILLTERGVAKIGDLGVARAIQTGGKGIKKNVLTTTPGALEFMPPETFCSNPVYDASLDVFSFGGIILFVITEQWPEPTGPTIFDQDTQSVVGFTEIQRRQEYLNKLDGKLHELRLLVESCLDNDPNRRPDMMTLSEKMESLKLESTSPPEVYNKTALKPCYQSLPNVLTPITSTQPNDAHRRHSHLIPPIVSSQTHQQQLQDVSITSLCRRRRTSKAPTLGEALQSDNCNISWTRCANLPAPMYGASVAVSNQNVYVAAGVAPEYHIYRQIFCYNIKSNRWSRLPSPEQTLGILFMVDGKLNLLGGNNADNTATNKVSTFNSDINKWVRHFPNMLKKRIQPGVVAYLEHVIVAGGARDKTDLHDDIEILNSQQSPLQWKQVNVTLPVPMWTVSLTVSSDKLMIVGYCQAKGRSTSVYQLPVKSLIKKSSCTDVLENCDWNKLCSAPHHDASLVPRSNPPVIVGGNFRGHPTSNISVYNASENCWKNCGSLFSPRINVAVASIYDDTIIVIGGHTKGTNVEVAMESALATVEMGKVETVAENVSIWK